MAGVKGGLRKMKVTTESGTDVKNTQMISGHARPTKAWKEKNETSEYSTGKSPHGALGGENTSQ